MHKIKWILAIMIIMTLTMSTVVFAKEAVLDVTITSMVEKVDKNGNAYIRFIADMPKTLQGQSYVVGTPIMAFGGAVEKAREYKAGDNLKCIAKYREFGSSESYTILAYMQ